MTCAHFSTVDKHSRAVHMSLKYVNMLTTPAACRLFSRAAHWNVETGLWSIIPTTHPAVKSQVNCSWRRTATRVMARLGLLHWRVITFHGNSKFVWIVKPLNSAALESDNVIMALATQDKQMCVALSKSFTGIHFPWPKKFCHSHSTTRAYSLEMVYEVCYASRRQVLYRPKVTRLLSGF